VVNISVTLTVFATRIVALTMAYSINNYSVNTTIYNCIYKMNIVYYLQLPATTLHCMFDSY
jgi:hypothetical protein